MRSVICLLYTIYAGFESIPQGFLVAISVATCLLQGQENLNPPTSSLWTHSHSKAGAMCKNVYL